MDLISKQAAIDVLHAWERAYTWDDTCRVDGEKVYAPSEVIEDLPTAEPERKSGRWTKMSDADGIYYCCSECGEELYRRWSFDRDYDLFPKKETIERTNFCPNCGSYNGGE